MRTLRTPVCHLLGIEWPIVSAGMAVHTSPELVAAVSNAGGLGLIGTVFRPLDDVAAQLAQVRALTARPFGANVVLAEPHAALLDLLLGPAAPGPVPVLSTSWGDPAPVVTRAHAAGTRLIHQVETVAEARAAVAAGVDVLVAQGTEGGGHVGRVGTMALTPAVVDVAGDVPVLAAGGIADGRGLAAALALGAQGVLLGTRFLATREAPVPAGWKQAILAAAPEDAWQNDVDDIIGETRWPGATVRALANDFLRTWHGRESDIPASRAAIQSAMAHAAATGDASGQLLYAGSSAGLIHDLPGAGELVARIIAEARGVVGGGG